MGRSAPAAAQSCERCAVVYQPTRYGQRFCSRACYSATRRIRADDDGRVRRRQRETAARGLTRMQRRVLLHRWLRQHIACAYCPAPAATVDHVVPLVRGGTNAEGNLVPCCRRCNSAKAGLLVIEWRTGLRLHPMTQALPARERVTKTKQPRPTKQCPMCGGEHHRPRYCSPTCCDESDRRRTRNAYRVRVGLPIDDRPVKRRTAIRS